MTRTCQLLVTVESNAKTHTAKTNLQSRNKTKLKKKKVKTLSSIHKGNLNLKNVTTLENGD